MAARALAPFQYRLSLCRCEARAAEGLGNAAVLIVSVPALFSV